MARPRTIDRDHLLDVAEEIVTTSSASALSFGSVAAAAGVPKASVQSAFKSREALIDAMLDRWLKREQRRFEELPHATPRQRILAHLQTTADEDAGRRMATLQAAIAGSGEQSASAVAWYKSRVGSLAASTREERRMRIAYLAADGAFYMRHLVGLELSAKRWREIFDDLRALVEDDSPEV